MVDQVYSAAYTAGVVDHWGKTVRNGFVASKCSNGQPENEWPAVDLHGFSAPVAHAAIRAALFEYYGSLVEAGYNSSEIVHVGLVIITGKGRNSLNPYRPVLRPDVQSLLVETFNPPISSWTAPGNTGRLLIGAEAIVAWAEETARSKASLMRRLSKVISARLDES